MQFSTISVPLKFCVLIPLVLRPPPPLTLKWRRTMVAAELTLMLMVGIAPLLVFISPMLPAPQSMMSELVMETVLPLSCP